MSRSRPTAALLAVLVAALIAAGCSIGDDGPTRSQTRDVARFTRVANDASVEVRVRVGAPQRVEVHAGEKVIDDVRTAVHDGTLEVTFDHHGFGGDPVVVEATVPRLTAIDVSGSGDVHVDGVSANALEIRSDGSADVTVRGAAGRLELDMDGSGDADLADLRAATAHVEMGGSGDADVRAEQRLEVTVDGSGDLRYHGDPELERHVDGSGGVSRVG